MIIIPAIDLKNGEAVRLYKGDYQQKQSILHHQKCWLKPLKTWEQCIFMLWIWTGLKMA